MGFIGKLFILLFGASSLLCLIWATVIYTQKMDFIPPKQDSGSKEKAVSRVEKAMARTKELNVASNRAYTRWAQEFDDVVNLEIERFQRREFYKGQLEMLYTGMVDGMKQPIQTLVVDETTGLLPFDKPTGRDPILVKGKPLETLNFYFVRLQKAGEDMQRLTADIRKIIADHAKSTIAMNGQKEPPIKGLRTRIQEQEEIEAAAIAEALYLDDYITNRTADAELFTKRRDSLQARVEELKKYFKNKDGGAGN
jgi:hypothetical protein